LPIFEAIKEQEPNRHFNGTCYSLRDLSTWTPEGLYLPMQAGIVDAFFDELHAATK
jgi:hypothetical protein